MLKKKKDDPIRKELLNRFGERLRSIRLKKKLTLEGLGGLIDMNKQAISRLEVGGTNPTLTVINKICAALEIKLAYFFKEFK